jgi:hypothetical protein
MLVKKISQQASLAIADGESSPKVCADGDIRVGCDSPAD